MLKPNLCGLAAVPLLSFSTAAAGRGKIGRCLHRIASEQGKGREGKGREGKGREESEVAAAAALLPGTQTIRMRCA
jgi:hypothetical protein